MQEQEEVHMVNEFSLEKRTNNMAEVSRDLASG